MNPGARETVRPARLGSRWRALLHGLVLAAGWALFAAGWVVVTRRPNEVTTLWMLMVAAVLLLPVVTLGWVLHNVGIYKRLGPRRAVRTVAPRYERDFNGRPVRADWKALSGAGYVQIDIDADGAKCYQLPTAPRVEGLPREAVSA